MEAAEPRQRAVQRRPDALPALLREHADPGPADRRDGVVDHAAVLADPGGGLAGRREQHAISGIALVAMDEEPVLEGRRRIEPAVHFEPRREPVVRQLLDEDHLSGRRTERLTDRTP